MFFGGKLSRSLAKALAIFNNVHTKIYTEIFLYSVIDRTFATIKT